MDERPYLEVLDGEHRGKRLVLPPGETTIGRGDEALIRFEDPGQVLSRVHVRIEERDGEFLVRGLGTNGTQVGRREVGEEGCVLDEGAVIVLAKAIKLRFHRGVSVARGRAQSGSPRPAATRSRRPPVKMILLAVWGGLGLMLVMLVEGSREAAPPTAWTVADVLRWVQQDAGVGAARDERLVRLVREIRARADRDEVRCLLAEAALAERRGDQAQAQQAWRNVLARALPQAGEEGGQLWAFARDQLARLGD